MRNQPTNHNLPLLPLVLAFVLIALVVTNAFGQTGSLQGRVTDQNGAVVIGAKVTVHGPAALVKTTTTDINGSYSFANLPTGDYTIEASAPSLVLQAPVNITVKSGTQTVNLQLSVTLPEQKITVEQDSRPTVSTDSRICSITCSGVGGSSSSRYCRRIVCRLSDPFGRPLFAG